MSYQTWVLICLIFEINILAYLAAGFFEFLKLKCYQTTADLWYFLEIKFYETWLLVCTIFEILFLSDLRIGCCFVWYLKHLSFYTLGTADSLEFLKLKFYLTWLLVYLKFSNSNVIRLGFWIVSVFKILNLSCFEFKN